MIIVFLELASFDSMLDLRFILYICICFCFLCDVFVWYDHVFHCYIIIILFLEFASCDSMMGLLFIL